MQLLLCLLNDEGFADRFKISPTKSLFVLATWTKLLSKLLKSLVAWLTQKGRRDNLPETFIKTYNNNLESF